MVGLPSMDVAKSAAVDGAEAFLGITVYSKLIETPLTKALGSFLGKYTGAGAGYLAALATRAVSDSEWARFAAAGIFGDALAAVFGTQDPINYPNPATGANPAGTSAFQGLAPVTLGGGAVMVGR